MKKIPVQIWSSRSCFLSLSQPSRSWSQFFSNARVLFMPTKEFDSIFLHSARPIWRSFRNVKENKKKWNNELKWFGVHCAWQSIFHPCSTDNQFDELGTSVPNFRWAITKKDLHLLAYTIVFNWFIFHLVYTSLLRQNIYSSSLSTNSQIYSRDCDKQYFYYESIRIKVIKSGYYSFPSYSTIDAYGFIYKNTFNPLNPSENLLGAEVSRSSDLQFRLDIALSGGMTYVLVMTTNNIKQTGPFSITVHGLNKVIVERLSEYIYICSYCIINSRKSKVCFLNRTSSLISFLDNTLSSECSILRHLFNRISIRVFYYLVFITLDVKIFQKVLEILEHLEVSVINEQHSVYLNSFIWVYLLKL